MIQEQVVPTVPWVYREDGYLILTLKKRAGYVQYITTREGGKSVETDFPRFMARMTQPDPPCNPYRMMLNVLAQSRIGTLRVRVRDERKILSMLESSRDELLKLDLAKLGHEYARIVGKKPPPQSTHEQLIEELLMQVKEEVAKKEDATATEKPAEASAPAPAAAGDTPATPATPATPTPAENKEQKVTTKKKGSKSAAATKSDLVRYEKAADKKKGAGKKDAKKKPAAKPAKPAKKDAKAAKPAAGKKEKAAKKPGDNPFREGSMKAKAFDFYKQCGGDRGKCLEKMESLGATTSTAKSWYAVFCKV